MEIICDHKSSILKKMEKAILGREKKLVVDIAKKAVNLGIEVIELCLSEAPEDETAAFIWAISTIQKQVSVNFMLNSNNMETVKASLDVHEGPAWIYAGHCDRKKMMNFFPLAAKKSACVVGKITTNRGIPESMEEQLTLAMDIVVGGNEFGIKSLQLFLDPVVQKFHPEEDKSSKVLKLLNALKNMPKSEVQTILRLSELGKELPNKKRALIEHIYLIMAMQEGLDAVILDPQDNSFVESMNIVEFFQNKRLSLALN